MRELISKKYYVRIFAFGYSNGRHYLHYDEPIPVYLHQFEDSNTTFWDEEIGKSYEKYNSSVDAYAAIQRVADKDRNSEYRKWNFGVDSYRIIEEKIYRIVETEILNNDEVLAEYALFNQQMTQDLKDEFVKIKPIADTSPFIEVVKKDELQAETKFDMKSVMAEAQRMAELAGFDGPVEGLLEDE